MELNPLIANIVRDLFGEEGLQQVTARVVEITPEQELRHVVAEFGLHTELSDEGCLDPEDPIMESIRTGLRQNQEPRLRLAEEDVQVARAVRTVSETQHDHGRNLNEPSPLCEAGGPRYDPDTAASETRMLLDGIRHRTIRNL